MTQANKYVNMQQNFDCEFEVLFTTVIPDISIDILSRKRVHISLYYLLIEMQQGLIAMVYWKLN